MPEAGNHANGVGPDGLTPYRVLNTRKRSRAGFVYLGGAAAVAAITVAIDLPLLWLTGVAPLTVIAIIHFVTSWKMPISDMRAIEIASGEASFDVGHGSATLGYRGPLAKPVWQVLVFSDTPSPDMEALVTVDAMTGNITGHFEQPIEIP